MFNLFQSIFRPGPDKTGAYPEDLISRATERAVDATDSRLRALSGYRKQLRPAIIAAIDHVVALVDRLPPPLELSRYNFSASAELNAYFASVDHMNATLSRDAEMRAWQKAPDSALADRIYALLAMEMNERKVLGVALDGNELRHDVAQVTVGFARHRLLDPAGDEDETRRLLKRRAYDHLLSLALGAIAGTQGERVELERERDLLRSKLAALAAGHWGFGDDTAEGTDAAPPDPRALQQRIQDIDAELGKLSTGKLQTHLDALVEVLSSASKNLYGEAVTLCVDRQAVKQAQPSPLAPPITLTVLHNAAGRSLVVRMVGIARADLPPPPDFLREAQRYLG